MLVKRGNTWYTRLMFDGRLYQRSLKTHKKDDAVKYEAAFRTSLVKGEFGLDDGRDSPTLGQFEPRLLPHLEAHVAERTYGFYKSNLKILRSFVPMDSVRLHQIDASLVEQFVQHQLKKRKKGKPLAAVTINHSLRTLRRVLHVAKEWKLLRDIPTIKLLPDENQREYVLQPGDVKGMTAHLAAKYPDSVMRYMLPFLVDTGLRISEASSLKIGNVQRTSKPWSVQIVKGKSPSARRVVPLTNVAADALAAALSLSKCEWVFTTNAGRTQIKSNWPTVLFKRTRNALGIGPECVLHATRHTYCTRLGLAGADAFTIQKLAGHKSISISQRYVHADLAAKEKAVALLNVLNKPTPKSRWAVRSTGGMISIRMRPRKT